MAYVNKVLVLSMLSLGVATQASWANETLWRVDADDQSTRVVVPSFTAQSNPFPMRVAPTKWGAPVKTERKEDESEKFARVERALDLLASIRALLRDDELFRADISSITATAYMNVGGKKSVLTGNKWMHEGDDFDVPIVARDQLDGMLKELKGLSKELATVVAGEIADRMRTVNNFDVVISEIHSDKMILTDQNQLQHAIPIGVSAKK